MTTLTSKMKFLFILPYCWSNHKALTTLNFVFQENINEGSTNLSYSAGPFKVRVKRHYTFSRNCDYIYEIFKHMSYIGRFPKNLQTKNIFAFLLSIYVWLSRELIDLLKRTQIIKMNSNHIQFWEETKMNRIVILFTTGINTYYK